MVTLQLGNKKKSYPSITAAAKANNMSYSTLWMRLNSGKTVPTAVKTPVRKYGRDR